jgi:hypothetical protein
VNIVGNLDFRVVDEWEWPKHDSGHKGMKGWQIGLVAGSAGLIMAVAIVVSVILVRRRDSLDAQLLTVSRG